MQDTGGGGSQRASVHMADTPRGSWASSIFDLKNSQADALLPKLLEREPQDEVDQLNEGQRQLSRQDDIFSLYSQQPEVRFLILSTSNP